MMKKLLCILMILSGLTSCIKTTVNLAEVTIVYDASDAPLVAQMAETLAGDIEMVSGVRPSVSTVETDGPVVVLGTAGNSSVVSSDADLNGKWESYSIKTGKGCSNP